MAESLTFETLLEEVQTKIKSLEKLLADDWKVQRQKIAEKSADIQYRLENKIAVDWREDEGLARGQAAISQAKTNAQNELKQLKKDEEILIRDIDERNRQQAEFIDQFTNTISTQLSNDITNTKNDVIAQSMQNADLRNKIIIGGVIVAAVTVGLGYNFKKKRSRK